MQKTNKLEKLWERGKQFLGVDYAILGGAMSWISESNLVSNMSNAGGFGVLAAGAMDAKTLESEIKKTQEKTNKNFGVNLIVMHPDLKDLIGVCIQQKVSHVILAGGIPNSEVLDRLDSHNIQTMAFSPNLALAKRMIRNKVKAIIIEGNEAGGHIGPVSTSVLVQEVLPYINDVPVFVAGGIATGEMTASYLLQGAAGVQVGTILVCSEECVAHDNFKDAFLRANARDAISTVQIDSDFPVIPVRAINNKGSQDFISLQYEVIKDFKSHKVTKEEAQLKIEHYWAGALRRAVIDGDIEYGSLMAGQSVGMCKKKLPIKTIIQNLIIAAEEFLDNKA